MRGLLSWQFFYASTGTAKISPGNKLPQLAHGMRDLSNNRPPHLNGIIQSLCMSFIRHIVDYVDSPDKGDTLIYQYQFSMHAPQALAAKTQPRHLGTKPQNLHAEHAHFVQPKQWKVCRSETVQ